MLFTRNPPYRQKQILPLVKGEKKIHQANGPGKKEGVPILISDKEDFISKLIRRDRECHFILMRGVIHQEEIIFINLYVPNVGTPIFIKYILLDFKTDLHTVVVEDSHTPL
jgi:hypothetical protein